LAYSCAPDKSILALRPTGCVKMELVKEGHLEYAADVEVILGSPRCMRRDAGIGGRDGAFGDFFCLDDPSHRPQDK
jgi:hypothetical protein